MASLHNILFFKECRHILGNRSRVTEHGDSANVLGEAADNDFLTYTDETDIDIDISDGSSATRVDAVFLKSTGVTDYSCTPSGGSGDGFTDREIASTVKNYVGKDVDTTVDGFQHDLALLETHFTATDVRLQLTGTNVRIYEVMLLELGEEVEANLSDILALNSEKVDRAGRIDVSNAGNLQRSSSRANVRHRREMDWTIKVVPGKSLMDDVDGFLQFMEDNPEVIIAEEFSRNPQWVYPAIFSSTTIPVRYRSDYKPSGYSVNFETLER